MADISKCSGETKDQACPFRYSCKRFTAPASPYLQAYITTPPYNPVTHSCPMFWSNKPTELPRKETRA